MKKRIPKTRILLSLAFLLGHGVTLAQNNGIGEATDQVTSFFESGVNLIYAIGGLVGLIGAVKVFNKWNSGEPDTGKVAAAWFGSCIFLVVVAAILKSFFNI